jgi:hypothetical protein
VPAGPGDPERVVEGVDEVAGFEVGENLHRPGGPEAGHVRPTRGIGDRPQGERAERLAVVVEGEPVLLEVVDALGTPGGLARRLDGGQQESDQDGDDGDDDEEFDEGETAPRVATTHRKSPDGVRVSCERP